MGQAEVNIIIIRYIRPKSISLASRKNKGSSTQSFRSKSGKKEGNYMSSKDKYFIRKLYHTEGIERPHKKNYSDYKSAPSGHHLRAVVPIKISILGIV